MKSFNTKLKPALLIASGVGVALLVIIVFVVTKFNPILITKQKLFSLFSENNAREEISAFVAEDNNVCSEKESIRSAKDCTFLIGNSEQHGSSFVTNIDGKDWLITNYHVINYSTDGLADVFYRGENHKSRIIGYSIESDIAVLDVEADLTSCTWTNSNNLDLAENVYAVGWPNSPFGESTITKGVYSRNLVLENGTSAIQTDTPINPGNSGGPLVSKCGVVGINTAKILPPTEGIGYAVTSNYALGVIKNIIKNDNGSPAIPVKKEVTPSETQNITKPEEITSESPVGYDYTQVVFWEQRKIQDTAVLDNWEKAKKIDVLNTDDLDNLLDVLDRSLEISTTLWDGYTNSKLTYGQVIQLKQEYLMNSNKINILSQELNLEGSINSYKNCLSAWDELEKEYNDDFSEQKKECEKFIDFE